MIEEVEDQVPLLFTYDPMFRTRLNTWISLFDLVWRKRFGTLLRVYLQPQFPQTPSEWFDVGASLVRHFETQWFRMVVHTSPPWSLFEYDFLTRLWHTLLCLMPAVHRADFARIYTSRLNALSDHQCISLYGVAVSPLPATPLDSVVFIPTDWLIPLVGAFAFVSTPTHALAKRILRWVVMRIAIRNVYDPSEVDSFKRCLLTILDRETVSHSLLSFSVSPPTLDHPYAFLCTVVSALLQYIMRNSLHHNHWITSLLHTLLATSEWNRRRSILTCVQTFPAFAGKRQWIQELRTMRSISLVRFVKDTCRYYPCPRLPSYLRFLGTTPMASEPLTTYQQDVMNHTRRQFPNVYIPPRESHGGRVSLV